MSHMCKLFSLYCLSFPNHEFVVVLLSPAPAIRLSIVLSGEGPPLGELKLVMEKRTLVMERVMLVIVSLRVIFF